MQKSNGKDKMSQINLMLKEAFSYLLKWGQLNNLTKWHFIKVMSPLRKKNCSKLTSSRCAC